MKVCWHYRSFIEMHGYLELPCLGRFESMGNGETGSKPCISFFENFNSPVDETLVHFLSEKLNKERSVINSDLQSFTSAVRELLLYGHEAEIPGIGYLKYSLQNILEFTHTSIYNESASPKQKKHVQVTMNSSFWMW